MVAFYNDKMDEVVDILTEKDFSRISKVPKWLTLKNTVSNTQPSSKKSDGATLYITRDLAAALYRKRTYDFAKAICSW